MSDIRTVSEESMITILVTRHGRLPAINHGSHEGIHILLDETTLLLDCERCLSVETSNSACDSMSTLASSQTDDVRC